MKVLLVQDTDWLRRGPHQQHHLMERLSVRGHHVTVVDFPFLGDASVGRGLWTRPLDVPELARFTEGANVRLVRPRVLRAPLLDKASMAFTYRPLIKHCIETDRPDIIIGMGIMTDWIARRLALKHRIPYVAFVIDALHQLLDIRPLRRLAKRVEAANLQAASHVLVINRSLVDYVTQLGADPAGVEILRSGVDLARIQSGATQRVAVRRKWNIPLEAHVLLFMGWLYDFSGVERVARYMLEQDDATHLLVVGDGDLAEALHDLAKTDRRGRLIVTGWLPHEDMPGLLAASDVCILPSDSNAVMDSIVPIKMYEYMAAGRPVVATQLPAIRTEFGSDGVVALAHDAEDVARTAIAMRDELPSHQIEAATAAVAQHDWSNIVQELERILGRLIDGRSTP